MTEHKNLRIITVSMSKYQNNLLSKLFFEVIAKTLFNFKSIKMFMHLSFNLLIL